MPLPLSLLGSSFHFRMEGLPAEHTQIRPWLTAFWAATSCLTKPGLLSIVSLSLPSNDAFFKTILCGKNPPASPGCWYLSRDAVLAQAALPCIQGATCSEYQQKLILFSLLHLKWSLQDQPSNLIKSLTN